MARDNGNNSTIYGADTSAAARYGTAAVQRPNLWDRETRPKTDTCPRACPKNNPRRHKRIPVLGQWDTLFSLNKEKKREMVILLLIERFLPPLFPVPLSQEVLSP